MEIASELTQVLQLIGFAVGIVLTVMVVMIALAKIAAGFIGIRL